MQGKWLGPSHIANQFRQASGAPPIYRPQSVDPIQRQVAPPAYRPPSGNITHQKTAPNVYRPAPSSLDGIRRISSADRVACSRAELKTNSNPNKALPWSNKPVPIQRVTTPAIALKSQSIKYAPVPVGAAVGAVQPFSVAKLSPDDYGKGKSRFAAHYRVLAANTTVDNEKAAQVLTSSNVATFKLIRRSTWEQINAGTANLGGSDEENWRTSKKQVNVNKRNDIRFITIPSDSSRAVSWNEGAKTVKSAEAHSERRIFAFIKERLIHLGVRWPEDWIIEWVYTERAPCQTRQKHSSGYNDGCSSLMSIIEREQSALLRVYYSFDSKKQDSNGKSAKVRINQALGRLRDQKIPPALAKTPDISVHRQQSIIGILASTHALDIRLNQLKETISTHYKPNHIGSAGVMSAHQARGRWLTLLKNTQEKRVIGNDELSGRDVIDGDYEDKRRFAREILLWFASDGINGTPDFVNTFHKTCDYLESQLV